MYTSLVDFKLIEEINRALKNEALPFEVHAYSGCAACGLHLVYEDDQLREKAIEAINGILRKKWMKAVENETDLHMLYIQSIFDNNSSSI